MVQKSVQPDVERICDRIVRGYDPDKIVLFGSAAIGSAREGSDIDLLIVKRTKKPYLDRVLEVARLLPPAVHVDLVILTPDEMARAIAENRYFLTKEILAKGRVLYERPIARSRRSRLAATSA